MRKVKSEIEALSVCKEYRCKVEFRKDFNLNREFVVISLNAWTTVAGKDLVEAVNRLNDLYYNAPIDYENLEWMENNKKLLNGTR